MKNKIKIKIFNIMVNTYGCILALNNEFAMLQLLHCKDTRIQRMLLLKFVIGKPICIHVYTYDTPMYLETSTP